MLELTIVEIFSREDEDFGGDYIEVEVRDGDDLITEYGDHYHDKGRERAEAFIEGWMMAKGHYPGSYKVKCIQEFEPVYEDLD
jgi:hypothetical protein